MQPSFIDPDKFQIELFQLDNIVWPTVPGYGADHHKQLMLLATDIGEREGLDKQALLQLQYVATFHDVGRTQPYGSEDPGHYQRSAELAEQYFKMDNGKWFQGDFITEVCRLIANHGYSERTSDKRLQVFNDAERMESVRFFPNEKEGLRIVKEVAAADKMYTAFGKDRNNLRTWMRFRGWRI